MSQACALWWVGGSSLTRVQNCCPLPFWNKGDCARALLKESMALMAVIPRFARWSNRRDYSSVVELFLLPQGAHRASEPPSGLASACAEDPKDSEHPLRGHFQELRSCKSLDLEHVDAQAFDVQRVLRAQKQTLAICRQAAWRHGAIGCRTMSSFRNIRDRGGAGPNKPLSSCLAGVGMCCKRQAAWRLNDVVLVIPLGHMLGRRRAIPSGFPGLLWSTSK